MSKDQNSNLSEEQWKLKLNKEQFRVLRQKGTEKAFSGEYETHFSKEGTYDCVGCGQPLYKASTKFDSGCGWPAFFEAISGNVEYKVDKTLGMTRTEVLCSKCGGHLGHVFKGEKYKTPTDERHCVNSICLKFDPNNKI